MAKNTLSKARGLNSIADPSDYKGFKGRATARKPEVEPAPAPVSTEVSVDHSLVQPPQQTPASAAAAPLDHQPAQPASSPDATTPPVSPEELANQRQRRELSVPIFLLERVNQIGQNPTDVVMRAYRNHADYIFAGQGARTMIKGRKRLRLSISDGDFAKITRLGKARGWNRSETVSVLLSLELNEVDDA